MKKSIRKMTADKGCIDDMIVGKMFVDEILEFKMYNATFYT